MCGRAPDAAGAAFFVSQLARHFVTRFEELGSAAPAIDDGDALVGLVAGVGVGLAQASASASCAQADGLLQTPAAR